MKRSSSQQYDVYAIREDFPVFRQRMGDSVWWNDPVVYFDNGSTTQRPRQVIRAMAEVCEDHYGSVHRAIHWLGERTTVCFEEAREKVRSFINAESVEEIIFTSGTTHSINLVARSWGDANIRAGDEILLSEMEHHANIVPWQQLAQRCGATLCYLPLTEDGQLGLYALDRMLNRRTRLVALTAVSNVLGTINPIEEIISKAHDVGAVVLIDGAQSVPHLPTDVEAMGADFLAFSGHKMLGPNGIGVLYGRRELLEEMPPFFGGGNMMRRVGLESHEAGPLPAKFEAGTPPIVPAIGLGAAIDYLNTIGMGAVVAHERRLTKRIHKYLNSINEVKIIGPDPHKKSGIVSFTIDGVHPHDAAQLLDHEGVAVRTGHHCAMPLHQRYGISQSIRASFSVYNTLDEIDRFADALDNVLHFFKGPG